MKKQDGFPIRNAGNDGSREKSIILFFHHAVPVLSIDVPASMRR